MSLLKKIINISAVVLLATSLTMFVVSFSYTKTNKSNKETEQEVSTSETIEMSDNNDIIDGDVMTQQSNKTESNNPINNVIENADDSIKEDVSVEIPSIIQSEFVNDEEKYITISFAGDCTFGGYSGQGNQNSLNSYLDEHGINYFFEKVKHVFNEDDVTFLNLEGPLTTRTPIVNKEYPISCKPECANILSTSGVEVVSLANNHIYDCGEDGLKETKNVLDENGIMYCGNGDVARMVIDEVQISFLGYKQFYFDNGIMERLESDIRTEREAGSKLVCIMFHSGTEKEYTSNAVQERLFRYAIDMGADIVVGSHPHVIQGIELYKDKVICYSLGNFCFGANRNPKDKDTLIYQQTFKVKGDSIEYGEYKVIPCSISSEKDKNNYQPIVLEGTEYERVLNKIKKNSEKYERTLFSEN